jgi:trimeric autotransporter adhesin
VEGEPVNAYIYSLTTGQFTSIDYPGAQSTTAYGVWHDGGNNYKITGGYVTSTGGAGFLVDYNASTGSFTDWMSISYPNTAVGPDAVTHIEGISSIKNGVYTLSGDSYPSNSFSSGTGLFIAVKRNCNRTFGNPSYVTLTYPDSTGITSANSVYGNQVVGIVTGNSPPPYQASVKL